MDLSLWLTFKEMLEFAVFPGFSFLSRPLYLVLSTHTRGTPGKRPGTAHLRRVRITSFCKLMDESALRPTPPRSPLDTGDWLHLKGAEPMGAEAWESQWSARERDQYKLWREIRFRGLVPWNIFGWGVSWLFSSRVWTWCGLKQAVSLARTEKVRQASMVVEGRWFPGQLCRGREKPDLPTTLAAKLVQPVRKQQPDPFNEEEDAAGTGEGYLLFWIAGLSSPIGWVGEGGENVALRLFVTPSECPSLPLSAVVASRAPRKVLGSSTSAANSTPLSSRKGKKRPCKILEKPSQKEIRPGTTVLLTCEPPAPPWNFFSWDPHPRISSLPFALMSGPVSWRDGVGVRGGVGRIVKNFKSRVRDGHSFSSNSFFFSTLALLFFLVLTTGLFLVRSYLSTSLLD